MSPVHAKLMVEPAVRATLAADETGDIQVQLEAASHILVLLEVAAEHSSPTELPNHAVPAMPNEAPQAVGVALVVKPTDAVSTEVVVDGDGIARVAMSVAETVHVQLNMAADILPVMPSVQLSSVLPQPPCEEAILLLSHTLVTVALSVHPTDSVSARVLADGERCKVELAEGRMVRVKLHVTAASTPELCEDSIDFSAKCAVNAQVPLLQQSMAETQVAAVERIEEQVVRIALRVDEPRVCVALCAEGERALAEERSESRCAVARLVQAALPDISMSMKVVDDAEVVLHLRPLDSLVASPAPPVEQPDVVVMMMVLGGISAQLTVETIAVVKPPPVSAVDAAPPPQPPVAVSRRHSRHSAVRVAVEAPSAPLALPPDHSGAQPPPQKRAVPLAPVQRILEEDTPAARYAAKKRAQSQEDERKRWKLRQTAVDPTALAHLKATALVQLAKTDEEKRMWEQERDQLHEQMLMQESEQEAAAMQIQRVARGRKDRKTVYRMKQEKKAAVCIQRNARGFMDRKKTREVKRMLAEEAVRAERAAVELQRHARGMQARKTVKAAKQQQKAYLEKQLRVVDHHVNQVMVRGSSPFWKTRRARPLAGMPARLTGLSALGSSSNWKKPVVATDAPDTMLPSRMQPVGDSRVSLMDEIMEAAELARMRSGRRAMPRVPHDSQPPRLLQLSSLAPMGPSPRERRSLPQAPSGPLATQWHQHTKEVFRSLDSLQSYASTALRKVERGAQLPTRVNRVAMAFDPQAHVVRPGMLNPGTRARLRARQVEDEARIRMELRIREVEARPYRGVGRYVPVKFMPTAAAGDGDVPRESYAI